MTEPTPALETLLTPRDVAAWLQARGFGIHEDAVCKAIRAGQLPGYRVGGRYITPLPWLESWLRGPARSESAEATSAPAPLVIPFVGRRAS